jgi:hypothetical protein
MQCRALRQCNVNKPLDDWMLDIGHNWLLVHLIATFKQFNAL